MQGSHNLMRSPTQASSQSDSSRADETEALVIARAKAGDADAISGLYERYAPQIQRYIASRLSDPILAEDVCADVFVKVLESLPPTAADAEAGVAADELVELTGRGAPGGRWRRVTIGATDRRGKPETIVLLTNLTGAATVPARVAGAVYRRRWQIELFFKWLKCFARMDHLLSTSRNGITFQLYVAVIGVLLMYAQTGRRVSVYALAALGRLARGECTPQQAMGVIARRERERDLNRARQARLRARKKLA